MLKGLSKILLATALVITSTSVVSQFADAKPGCSAKEQRLIVKYSEASMTALRSGDFERYFQLVYRFQNALSPKLSPSCWAAIAQFQRSRQFPPGYPSPTPPGNIYDHGDGTFSGGGGACGPSGCMLFE